MRSLDPPSPPRRLQRRRRTVESNAAAGRPRRAMAGPSQVRPIATFDEPWAMAFLPGPAPRALITEKKGKLKLLWSDTGRVGDVAGAPAVDYGGQGGFGDVVLHPDFAQNRLVYLSWVEAGEGGNRGAVVGRARFVEDGNRRRGSKACRSSGARPRS